jgi:hypothetical protein
MVIDATLKQYVTQVQQQVPESAAWQQALSTLVTEMLKTRRIGRPQRGKALMGVYQDITTCLERWLLETLPEAIARYSERSQPLAEWLSQQLQRAYRQVLTDDLLKQLALDAQGHPAQSEARHHALSQLLDAIQLSGRLAHPHRNKFNPGFYDLLYDEAVNRTWVYLCRHIDSYDPDRGQNKRFMNWVNFRLDRMIIECRRDFDEQDVEELPSYSDLENLMQPAEPESLVDDLRECIGQDQEHLFQQTHIRDRPDVSFQAIALARLDNESWEAIANRFDVKIPTLSSFFQRCCSKFAPKFQEYL